MESDIFVMADFISADERNRLDAFVAKIDRPFFRIGPTREDASKALGFDVPRDAIKAAARRAGFKINAFNFATKGGSDGAPGAD